MAIPGYSGPLPQSAARPADVIAMGHHDDNEGRVGIYVGNGMTASAHAYQGGRITVNDWGFRGLERTANIAAMLVRSSDNV